VERNNWIKTSQNKSEFFFSYIWKVSNFTFLEIKDEQIHQLIWYMRVRRCLTKKKYLKGQKPKKVFFPLQTSRRPGNIFSLLSDWLSSALVRFKKSGENYSQEFFIISRQNIIKFMDITNFSAEKFWGLNHQAWSIKAQLRKKSQVKEKILNSLSHCLRFIFGLWQWWDLKPFFVAQSQFGPFWEGKAISPLKSF